MAKKKAKVKKRVTKAYRKKALKKSHKNISPVWYPCISSEEDCEESDCENSVTEYGNYCSACLISQEKYDSHEHWDIYGWGHWRLDGDGECSCCPHPEPEPDLGFILGGAL